MSATDAAAPCQVDASVGYDVVLPRSKSKKKSDQLGAYRRRLLDAVKKSQQWYTLTPSEKRYAAQMILRYANPALDGAMFPSQSRIAKELKTLRSGATASRSGRQSRRTALRALKGLCDKGVFIKTPGEAGRNVNTYRVHPSLLTTEATRPVTSSVSRPVTSSPRDDAQDVTQDVTRKVLRTNEALPSEEHGMVATNESSSRNGLTANANVTIEKPTNVDTSIASLQGALEETPVESLDEDSLRELCIRRFRRQYGSQPTKVPDTREELFAALENPSSLVPW